MNGMLAILGTDTGVGKTQVTLLLAAALRAAGRRVWLHKPVACGSWQGGAWPHGTAEDARRLAVALGDGQPAETLCPRQYPGEMSPHLAAARVGERVALGDLAAAVPRPADALVLVETAGGLLSPIADRRATNADLVGALGCPALLVTRPDLGTLNHTALTVEVARARGIPLIGLVINHHRPTDADDPALATAPAELAAITRLPVLAQVPHGSAAVPADWAAAVAAGIAAT